MPSARENLRMVLKGQQPAWVPFSLNFAQWFNHHQSFATLPPELRNCSDYLDAMLALGCDIFSRNINTGFCAHDTALQPTTRIEKAATGDLVTTIYDTPHGTLTTANQKQDELSTSHRTSYLVKDWQQDGDAFRWLLDQRNFDWDEQVFLDIDQRIGDSGIPNVSVGPSPLKMLHSSLGLDHTCMFVMDYPEMAKQLCDAYWAKVAPVVDTIARHERVESLIIMDNVDTPFYSPAVAREYWAPYVKQAADIARKYGKPLFVHACGRLKALAPLYAECRIAGLEGVTHPPLGDWTAAEAQACHENFIFIGGFGAHEQQEPDDQRVIEFYQQYLGAAQRSRFIFSSSCQTAVQTPWQRIQLVHDICRHWGGQPTSE